MCCNVLGEAENGEYLQFAREAVEHATAGLALEPENEMAQQMLRESKKILENAEADAKDQLLALPAMQRECDKAEAEANELRDKLAVRNPPVPAHESQSTSVMSPSDPLSYPQGPLWMEGEDDSEDGKEAKEGFEDGQHWTGLQGLYLMYSFTKNGNDMKEELGYRRSAGHVPQGRQ
ncbi:hypothetical protein OPT61_g877 [Boeremia exigua]|uniref:Uncharacterized protein n=1 Tax=Boeremia exigua TaxID=749465 RepID=A0ACC2ISC9_9PLEO|nr:hypothetical protein OPT61_g877 [Boeremia exigua]